MKYLCMGGDSYNATGLIEPLRGRAGSAFGEAIGPGAF